MNTKHLFAIAVMACSTVFSAAAFAHAKLEASRPAAGSVVGTAPKVVWLKFNEAVELPFTKVRLVDRAGTAGAPLKLALDKADPKAVVATLPVLVSGAHRVQWTTVTRDGHKVKGEFGFQVK